MCRCGITNWRALRDALGLSRREMARALEIDPSGLWYLERMPHTRCARTATLHRLQLLCSRAAMAERLQDAGITLPWPLLPEPTRDDQLCTICGLPLATHARCPECGQFFGVGHTWPTKYANHCNCGAWIGPKELMGKK